MKLSAIRVKQALDQLEPRAVVVPEGHPKLAALHEVFGEHTFFLDEEGLEIIEPAAPAGDDEAVEPAGENAGQVVRLAIWHDAARTTLAPHPAEATGSVILFPAAVRDRVDRAGEDSFPASDATPHSGITRHGRR